MLVYILIYILAHTHKILNYYMLFNLKSAIFADLPNL